VHDRRRSEKCIDHRERLGNLETAPEIGDTHIDGQDTPAVGGLEPKEPTVEGMSLDVITTKADALDAPANLTQREDGDTEILTGDAREIQARTAAWAASPLRSSERTFRVEQVAQSSTSRGRACADWSRSKSESLPAFGMLNKNALKSCFGKSAALS
jgi:hypothetical protein